jgi:hypothetical protein
MSNVARQFGDVKFLMGCAKLSWRFYQGGNQWSAWDSFLSFFQDIAKLALPEYEKYQHWRALAEHSGRRWVHEEFCIVSDRPEILLVDDQNRPHCDTGPFCRWRDGSALYSVHGVRVPGWIIETPAAITIAKIEAEANSEIQRVMIERFGWDRYADECGAVLVDHDERWGSLYRRDMPGADPIMFLRVINRSPEPDGTFRQYILPVHHECRPLVDDDMGDPQPVSALNAVASTFGLTGAEYVSALVGES